MDKQRLDKWLWAARFYKTRSVASEAIKKGQIAVNGQKIKPSRNITLGDAISITKAPYTQTVVVQGLNEQRRPASEAVALYTETPESLQSREAMVEKLRNDRIVSRGLRGEGRPDKRQRRQIIRFRSTQSGDSSENES